MEKGAWALARILLAALLMGALVLALNPDYRETLGALRRGDATSSPIWLSNQSYYPEVTLQEPQADAVAR